MYKELITSNDERHKEIKDDMAFQLNQLAEVCNGISVQSGWWTDLKTGQPLDRNKGEMISLMHSELSEALEGVRKGKMDDHLPHRLSEEVELADAIIRILDYAAGFNLDVGSALIEKLQYNCNREDHKLSNRTKPNGKKI